MAALCIVYYTVLFIIQYCICIVYCTTLAGGDLFTCIANASVLALATGRASQGGCKRDLRWGAGR